MKIQTSFTHVVPNTKQTYIEEHLWLIYNSKTLLFTDFFWKIVVYVSYPHQGCSVVLKQPTKFP